jgi:hypothetical protein
MCYNVYKRYNKQNPAQRQLPGGDPQRSTFMDSDSIHDLNSLSQESHFSDLDVQLQERNRILRKIKTAAWWRAYYLVWGCSGTEQYLRPRVTVK